jgi:hypothetical protein
MDALERLVVVDDRDGVGGEADVELEAVAGRDRERGEEGRDRVLQRVTRIPAMREAKGPSLG